jgi:hypothetical protein
MLFPDLFQRFWPVAVQSWDRSRGLEEVWSRDWDGIETSCGFEKGATPNPWTQPFTSLNQKRTGTNWVPEVALSSTALRAGAPVMQASFQMPRADSYDILDPVLDTESLMLVQAVHNSARFPYVSPAGVVMTRSHVLWDRLGDGGYIEASGTLVLGQIIRTLMEQGLIRTAGSSGQCPQSGADEGHSDCYISAGQMNVLILDNSITDEKTGWLCPVPSSGSANAGLVGPSENDLTKTLLKRLPVPDILAPVEGAFSTRDGRAKSAQWDLLQLAGGCTSGRLAELRLPRGAGPKVREPSMNWMLNQESRALIDAILTSPVPGSHLDYNLSVIRTWL